MASSDSRWKPGQSGNAGGRPKGLSRLVRETVGDDMTAIIKAQVAIAKGTKPEGVGDLPPIKASDMTKAAEWLSDRGWGKPQQTVNVHEGPVGGRDFSSMTDEELDAAIAADDDYLAGGHDGPRRED